MGNGIVRSLKYIINCILEVVYDDSGECTACKNILEEGYICKNCSKEIYNREIKHSIKKGDIEIQCISAGYYSGKIKELILRLKYKSDFKCGRIVADILCDCIERNSVCYDYITYVPSGAAALKKRGYNQAAYIARLVSERTQKPLVHCISKSKETKDQIGLGISDRWLNLEGSFVISKKFNIKQKNFLLIDDVLTTGATAFYCSQLLMKNHFNKVMVLTMAKSTL